MRWAFNATKLTQHLWDTAVHSSIDRVALFFSYWSCPWVLTGPRASGRCYSSLQAPEGMISPPCGLTDHQDQGDWEIWTLVTATYQRLGLKDYSWGEFPAFKMKRMAETLSLFLFYYYFLVKKHHEQVQYV